jgi:hypothetical protein
MVLLGECFFFVCMAVNLALNVARNSTSGITLLSDGTATCVEQFYAGPTDEPSSILLVNHLSDKVQRGTVRVVGPEQQQVRAVKWIDSSLLDELAFLRIYVGKHAKITLETETKSSTGTSTVLTTTGLLLDLTDETALMRQEDGALVSVHLRDRLLRVQAMPTAPVYSQEASYDRQLMLVDFGRSKQTQLTLQYKLESGALAYQVQHRLELADERATTMHWTSEVLVANHSGMRLQPLLTITERKQDTRNVSIAPTQHQQQQTRHRHAAHKKSMARGRGGRSSDSEQESRSDDKAPAAYAMAAPPMRDLAGVTDLEMSRAVNLEAAGQDKRVPLLLPQEEWTRYSFRQHRDVPCRFFFLHRPDGEQNSLCETERCLDWEHSALFQGDFLFSGAVRALSAALQPLTDYALWHDAWKSSARQLLELGKSQRVMARRSMVGGVKVDEQAATERYLYRLEYQNQSPVEVQVKLLESFREANAKPLLKAAYRMVYDGEPAVAPTSVAALLDTPEAQLRGWKRSSTINGMQFVPSVDEYTDEQERRADPYHQVLMVRVPAGSKSSLSKPGRIVVFYELTCAMMRVLPVNSKVN